MTLTDVHSMLSIGPYLFYALPWNFIPATASKYRRPHTLVQLDSSCLYSHCNFGIQIQENGEAKCTYLGIFEQDHTNEQHL